MQIVVEAKFDCAQDEILTLAEIPPQTIELLDDGEPFRLATQFT